MSQTGRACAAAALAVTLSCGGSLPAPVTQPAPFDRAAAAPAARTVGVQPATTASLAGVVIDAETRRPLSRARVALNSPALSEPRVAITGNDGTYAFSRLPAGEYAVSAARTGFATRHYGERGSAPAATVALAAGQRASGIEIALPPAGVIVGQILDEDRQPFAGARVEALAPRTRDGQVSLVTMAATASDDRGAFRLSGLPAGQYYVSALDPAFAGVGDETGALTYTPTYYPGTPHLDEASRVTVVPGAEPSHKVVIALKIIRPARVSGMLSTFDQRRLTSGAVVMSPVRAEGLDALATRDVEIRPDGAFAFRNVPPGRYQIRARGEADQGGTAMFATFTVTVEGHDLDRLMMTLVAGGTIEGSVVADAVSGAPPPYRGMRVRAPMAAGGNFGDSLTGAVDRDGRFRIRGVMPGTHRVILEGLANPWVLESVRHRGQDVADVLDVESRQELRDVRVVITDLTTEVSGAVADERGHGAPRALVLFIPAAPRVWTPTSRRFRLLRTDGEGRYRIRGLPAGQYHVLATYDLDESDAYRQEVVQDLVARAVPLELGDRARQVADLRVVAFAPQPAPSR
jgi:hypothetical protein